MSAPPKPQQGGSKWGTFFSGAVAGLESRLDTILGEDDQASARSRAEEAAARQKTVEQRKADQGLQRKPSSRTRANDRLQERLAKAVKTDSQRPGSRASSELPSRTASPSLAGETTRTSIDSKARTSLDSKTSDAPSSVPVTDDKPAVVIPSDESTEKSVDAATEKDAEEVAKQPEDQGKDNSETLQVPSPRASLDSTPSSQPATASPAVQTPSSEIDIRLSFETSDTINDADVATLRQSYGELQKTHREEMHAHLERIDALQSKLKYLASQAATSARAAADDAASGSLEKKLAEKDEQIALLMEEGQTLSKKELNHLNSIKKLRAKVGEDERSVTDLKKRLAKAESNASDAAERAKRAEAQVKVTEQKVKQLEKVSRDAEAKKAENEEQARTIAELKKQLAAANERADAAEMKAQTTAADAEKKRAAELDEELADLRIEKKLVEDRAKAEVRDLKEEASRQAERAKAVETELRSEITNLETKLEVLRSRTEEASSGGSGDSQIKLLRQIETLQTQYSVASENWQGIESSLTSRVAALEKERDELAKREADVRRKAREVNSKSRRLEDELDSTCEKARALEHELSEQKAQMAGLQKQVTKAEKALEDAKASSEQQKKIWEAELQQKIEDEKTKWQLKMQTQLQGAPGGFLSPIPDSASQAQSHYLSPQTPSVPGSLLGRKLSSPGEHSIGLGAPARRSNMGRTGSSDLLQSLEQPSSLGRWSSGVRGGTPGLTTPTRQDSTSSLSQLNGSGYGHHNNNNNNYHGHGTAPSIHTIDDAETRTSSPHRTAADMISVSTVGAGPSVQLVERMSAAVRRLESEKAVSKEEMARLVAQRDEAREEVVALMREVDSARKANLKLAALEKELRAVNDRYDATLEMLGEKEERVVELESDVADLKKIYRDLVERTMA